MGAVGRESGSAHQPLRPGTASMSKPAGSTSGYLSGSRGVLARGLGRAGWEAGVVLLRALNLSPRVVLSRACTSVSLALLECCVGAFRATRRAISLLLVSPVYQEGCDPWQPTGPACCFYLAAGAEGGRGEPGAGTGPQLQAARTITQPLKNSELQRAKATLQKADFEWNALHPVSSYFK